MVENTEANRLLYRILPEEGRRLAERFQGKRIVKCEAINVWAMSSTKEESPKAEAQPNEKLTDAGTKTLELRFRAVMPGDVEYEDAPYDQGFVWIDPMNPYSGEVSVLALMENEKHGNTKFPCGMGDTVRKSPNDQAHPRSVGERKT